MSNTVAAKHIFLDVVGFTHERSVEDQTEIIENLNCIVLESMQLPDDADVIFLPTGDGICIVLISLGNPFDAHLRIAKEILRKLAMHNETAIDRKRRFEVRIGISENVDNLVLDINNGRNIAGHGINMAARVMAQADGNQILVSQSVYDVLGHRDPYMGAFREFWVYIKHGEHIPVYQYISRDAVGLNTDVPQADKGRQPMIEPRLPAPVAFYLGNLLHHRDFLLPLKDGPERMLVWARVLLWLRAKDDLIRCSTSGSDFPVYHTRGYKDGVSFPDQLAAFVHEECDLVSAFDAEIIHSLERFSICFRDPAQPLFVSLAGRLRLATEWPGIWDKFDLQAKYPMRLADPPPRSESSF